MLICKYNKIDNVKLFFFDFFLFLDKAPVYHSAYSSGYNSRGYRSVPDYSAPAPAPYQAYPGKNR